MLALLVDHTSIEKKVVFESILKRWYSIIVLAVMNRISYSQTYMYILYFLGYTYVASDYKLHLDF